MSSASKEKLRRQSHNEEEARRLETVEDMAQQCAAKLLGTLNDGQLSRLISMKDGQQMIQKAVSHDCKLFLSAPRLQVALQMQWCGVLLNSLVRLAPPRGLQPLRSVAGLATTNPPNSLPPSRPPPNRPSPVLPSRLPPPAPQQRRLSRTMLRYRL